MDPAVPDPSNRFTPAKHKADETPTASESDIISKKLKVEETSAAIEDDFLSKAPAAKEDHPPSPEVDYFLTQNFEDEKLPISDQGFDVFEWEPPETDKDFLHTEHGSVKGYKDAFSNARSDLRAERITALIGDFRNDKAKSDYENYIIEFNESEGFDIEHFCSMLMGALLPVALRKTDPGYEDGCWVIRDCELSVKAAIAYHNHKTNYYLEFVDIVKCFFSPGTCYYATFKAKDLGGVTRIYQTQVERDHFTGETIVVKFRLRPGSSSQPQQ